ncbi:hypothetical protein OnM2_026005 [Erysiphe neolycopersici]|uniref:IBR domain-containing protein n=1 Tax=Erysiphe neolycopersici TaxID=212602 RepID=A0A420I0R5_9PEZI|nr:hypothetical protein OnM2_026005 [Erysiphe neolycopersici]
MTFDDDSDILVLKLHLEDIKERQEQLKGKWNEKNPPDFFVALDKYESDIKNSLICIEDAKIAQSIARAVDLDADLIREFTTEECQARHDHEMALRLRDGIQGINPEPSSPEKEVEIFRDVASSSLTHSSTSYARQADILERLYLRRHECVICNTLLKQGANISVGCPKGHVFCEECLRNLFLLSVSNEDMFPPKCCEKPIAFSLVSEHFTPYESKQFSNAKIEYSTQNRVYCFHSVCGKFIPRKESDGDQAECLNCYNKTCVHCKKAAHEGDCPADEALHKLIALAHQKNWVRFVDVEQNSAIDAVPSGKRVLAVITSRAEPSDTNLYYMSQFDGHLVSA